MLVLYHHGGWPLLQQSPPLSTTRQPSTFKVGRLLRFYHACRRRWRRQFGTGGKQLSGGRWVMGRSLTSRKTSVIRGKLGSVHVRHANWIGCSSTMGLHLSFIALELTFASHLYASNPRKSSKTCVVFGRGILGMAAFRGMDEMTVLEYPIWQQFTVVHSLFGNCALDANLFVCYK
jgi:hypothetical protein